MGRLRESRMQGGGRVVVVVVAAGVGVGVVVVVEVVVVVGWGGWGGVVSLACKVMLRWSRKTVTCSKRLYVQRPKNACRVQRACCAQGQLESECGGGRNRKRGVG